MSAEVLDINPVIVWVIALSQLLTFGLTVWGLISSGSRGNARTLEAHGAVLQGLEARLSAVELTMKDFPNRRDFHDLDLRMTKLQGAMEVLTERLRPIESISERLQEAMIDRRS